VPSAPPPDPDPLTPTEHAIADALAAAAAATIVEELLPPQIRTITAWRMEVTVDYDQPAA
jgi:hypothetical protein